MFAKVRVLCLGTEVMNKNSVIKETVSSRYSITIFYPLVHSGNVALNVAHEHPFRHEARLLAYFPHFENI
jgi:hypothetical protein